MGYAYPDQIPDNKLESFSIRDRDALGYSLPDHPVLYTENLNGRQGNRFSSSSHRSALLGFTKSKVRLRLPSPRRGSTNPSDVKSRTPRITVMAPLPARTAPRPQPEIRPPFMFRAWKRPEEAGWSFYSRISFARRRRYRTGAGSAFGGPAGIHPV